eukprot:TRINITY_DN30660_c0_g1_i1.p1 TRINITY_DN30660_c0_g1~~TRINITY_DN30660_c0_g1_i1.p1  ORF type:complete len:632 (-),score=127.43 TRINITY_DN30660_c0_g1_i1:99-1994(-)
MGVPTDVQPSHQRREYSRRLSGRLAVHGRYHRPPKRLDDNYEITSHILGTGYNGAVRMAIGKGPNSGPIADAQKYAVKTFALKSLNRKQKAVLESEVDIMLGMDHPHIGRLFDVYESTDNIHLVMECLAGGELFDRVMERKCFSEAEAAEAVRQMLLAVNYLHWHGIVHRDIKLENFLYEDKHSDHLKLIDFGYSKIWDNATKMRASCGTLSYVAPEVLKQSYTSQCDLWSIGVIAFILLSGYMPFAGSESEQAASILKGAYKLKPHKWNSVSPEALKFVQGLLAVDPEKRLTADAALCHPWLEKRLKQTDDTIIDVGIVESLRQYAHATRFRRCCMAMLAWSLSQQDRASVCKYFTAMDENKQGTITLAELKTIMTERFNYSDAETRRVFGVLDSNNDDTIHYSDFLAAMVSTRIELHSDLLRAAFHRFDTDSSGYITLDNIRDVLGDDFEGVKVNEAFMKEADILQDGRISYAEFVAYLCGTPLDSSLIDPQNVFDGHFRKGYGFQRQWSPMTWMRKRLSTSSTGVAMYGAVDTTKEEVTEVKEQPRPQAQPFQDVMACCFPETHRARFLGRQPDRKDGRDRESRDSSSKKRERHSQGSRRSSSQRPPTCCAIAAGRHLLRWLRRRSGR